MPPILAFRFLNDDPKGALISIALQADISTLDQATNTLPAGAYTTFRTYQKTSALHLDGHMERLVNSANLAGYDLRLNQELFRRQLRSAIAQHPADEVRVRLTIPFSDQLENSYLFVDALTVPTPAQRLNGVRTLTREMRRSNPSAKLTDFISSSKNTRQLLKQGYEEILMVEKSGEILEGLSSNFFAVVDGDLWTAGEGVLFGITREMVLQISSEQGLSLHLKPQNLSNLQVFDEAFITSTSRAVLPVTEIDHQPIGSGKPGPITQQLMESYERQVLREIEPI